MNYQFSICCKNYLPQINKCKSMILLNQNRNDLLETREFTLSESLNYFNYNVDLIIDKIKSKDILIRTFKTTETIKLKIKTTWSWDDCCLENSGGICIYYEKHPDAKLIEYTDQIKKYNIKHPDSTDNTTNQILPILESKIKDIINSDNINNI